MIAAGPPRGPHPGRADVAAGPTAGRACDPGGAAVTVVHHSAICVADVDESLRFWRDGLGFVVLMDERFDGDWPTLLEAPSTSLRAVFLGRPDRADAGIVELVGLGPVPDGPPATRPAHGFLLLSVMTDVEAALDRLARLGLGGEAEAGDSGGGGDGRGPRSRRGAGGAGGLRAPRPISKRTRHTT